MKCPFCGTKNRKTAKVCNMCGATLLGHDPVAVEPAVAKGSLEARVLDLLRQRRKIESVKLYRAETGKGLKEAKEAVELIAREHDLPTGSGCAGVLLLLAVGATLAVGIFV